MTTLAITGADMISSLGCGRAENFRALCAGASGNKPLIRFDADRYRFKRAYEIDDRDRHPHDVPGRATEWLRQTIEAAMRESRLGLDGARVALFVGTGLRELRSLELWQVEGAPFHAEQLHFGAAVQAATGAGAPVFTLSNACAASSFALGLAADLIALDEADVAIVAGSDSIAESMFGTLDRVTLDALEEVRPFDRNHKGVLMGEGAAAVVVEPVERAAARGACPLALLRSVGVSCDAHHETAPKLEGVVAAMSDAHRRANTTIEDVDLVVAHGTGTDLNDATEASAIRRFFEPALDRVPVTGLKGKTGHTSGASGLMGVIAAIEAMRQGCIPPLANSLDAMPEAEGIRFVVGAPRAAQIDIAQVNAFGFGGVNAVVILERAPA